MTKTTEHQFFPWVRTGMRPTGSSEDVTKPVADPGRFGVETTVEGSGAGERDDETIATNLSLYGPGEVTGIDTRAVVRTEPEPNAVGFTPNFFPIVEFDRPDFPWLFSPGVPTDEGKNRPWLCLVTVEQTEGVSITTEPQRPNPVLEIRAPASPGTELPDLRESWAWAHAQVVGEQDDPGSELKNDESVKTVSRLLSARRLRPEAAYYACVVPTFGPGVRAGLGEDPYPEGDRTATLAWSPTNPPGQIRLPVYHYWEFLTGPAGDFEALVRRLERHRLRNVGARTLDVSDPGYDELTPDQPTTVTLEGALRSADLSVEEYPESLADALRTIVAEANGLAPTTAVDDEGTPIHGPPAYGQWPPAVESIPETGPPAWLRELVEDPRFRVPAGFGTEVVRDQQEQLMDSAWEQLGEVRAANQLLSRAQLARGAGRSIHEGLEAAGDETTVLLTDAMHGHLRSDGRSVETKIEESSFPEAAFSAAFRRISRPNGPLARRFEGDLSAEQAVAGLESGEVSVGEPGPPTGAATLDEGIAKDLCETAREGRPEEWSPLGQAGGPDEALDQLGHRCRRFGEAAEAAAEAVPQFGNQFGGIHGEMIELCGGSHPAIGRIRDALADGSIAAVYDMFHGVKRTRDDVRRTVTQLESQASTNPRLAEELPRVSKAFDAFDEAVDRVELSLLPQLLAYHAGGMRSRVGRFASHSDDRVARIAKTILELLSALAETEDGDPGPLTIRLADALPETDLRRIAGLHTVLGLVISRIGERIDALVAQLREIDAPEDPSRGLAQSLGQLTDLLDLLSDALADAPSNSAAEAVAETVCPRPEEPAPELDLTGLATAVVGETNPAVTVPNRIADRIGGAAIRGRPDPLDQILAYPTFDQPMMEPLKDLSQEYLMPGVGEIPEDIVGALETNPKFVEAYMSGVNHEMARELRWREYPIHLRGTYFRQFWDPEGRVPEPSDEEKKDIDPMHRWDALGLGDNYMARANRLGDGDSDGEAGRVVMLVRGELFKRYPNTSVYAAKGVREDDGGERKPDLPDPSEGKTGTLEHPIFRGTLDPDITFFGFDLSHSEMAGDPGWFFVIEEAPGEPRFGLDVPVEDGLTDGQWNWDDLTWADVSPDRSPDSIDYVPVPPDADRPAGLPDDVSPPSDGPTWAKNGAHVAGITWQYPVRIAIHADDLLPPVAGTDDGGST